MTELLIVSKPRGRIHKWIYGEYRSYLTPISFGPFKPYITTIDATGDSKDLDYIRYQRFKTPNITPLYLRRVKLWMKKSKSSTAEMKIALRSDNDGSPGSWIADIGSVVVDDLPADFSTPLNLDCEIQLQPNTYYFIKAPDMGVGVVSWEMSTSDVYPDGYAYWNGAAQSVDFHMALVYTNFPGYPTKNIDFIYDGAVEKRLAISFSRSSSLAEIIVNGTSVGTNLAKEDSIPQADNYTITFKVSDIESFDIEGSIQRWLYYNKNPLTLDDLNASDAYLQEIEFGSSGGVLRIDDDPSGDISGAPGDVLPFSADKLTTFRKLEWISGGGEVTIFIVE